MDPIHTGGFADPSTQSAHAFRAAMRAMARPGTVEAIGGGTGPAPLSPAAATLLLVLCDPETGVFLAGEHDTADIRAWLAFHTGAHLVAPQTATFAIGTWDALQPVGRYRIGTPAYPDRGVTLIVEAPHLQREGASLSGPGIRTSAALNLPEIEVFRANRARFPLGFDCFFTAGGHIAALPRSTRVTAGEAA